MDTVVGMEVMEVTVVVVGDMSTMVWVARTVARRTR